MELTIVGAGLAGSEAAWQVASRGIRVNLFEMRPHVETGAHKTDRFAELVCSNSLGALLVDRATGLLQEEARRMGSLLVECATRAAIPAGGALAVDRERFADDVTHHLNTHPNINIIREEVLDVPSGPVIIATGPLTSPALTNSIIQLTGSENLFFFDAVAPIVAGETINMDIAFRASRYGRGVQADGDYINCPMNKEQYDIFVSALVTAQKIQLHDFDSPVKDGVTAGAHRFFEGCLPVEVLAERSPQALAYGPMRPVGLKDPRTGSHPYAVVQLRQDNLAGSLYNLVGFQTNLTFPEQKRVLRTIPGLENAGFVRYGQMHRNTFLASPLLLKPTLQLREYDNLFFAGQITGIEGYMGNIASGLLAGINAARFLHGKTPIQLPDTTMLGALCHYITNADLKDFQPMKANYGLPAALDVQLRGKRERAMEYARRSLETLDTMLPRIREGL